MKNRIVLVMIFSSFAMGLRAQCDTLMSANFKFEEDIIALDLDLSNVHPVDWDPPFTMPDTTPRRIYFVHGLGGDKSSWEKTAEVCEIGSSGFPARRCETIRTDYVSSTGSLYLAAGDVREGIKIQAKADRNGGKLDPSRAIVIAHSQGGVVMRELMHLDMVQQTDHSSMYYNGQYVGMNYGGVVTVASPLQGAMILNNRTKIIDMAEDGCKNLLLGPELDAALNVNIKLDLKGFWSGLASLVNLEDKLSNVVRNILGKVMNNITDPFCTFATDNVMPMFFKQYYAGITKAYDPGTVYGRASIDTLNRDTLNAQYKAFPKMAFYAVEPQMNIFWRTLNWMVFNPNGNNGANGPDVDYFEANDDWRLYDSVIAPLINFYEKRSEYYLGLYQSTSTGAAYPNSNWFNSLFGGASGGTSKNTYYQTYLAYKKGLTWFNNVNTNWQTIIGAKTIETIDIQLPFPLGKITLEKKEDNDGIVLAESAANLPGATYKPIKIYPTDSQGKVIGSSHMQVRNDAGLKKHLKALFDGDYDPWFRTIEQQ